MLKLLRNQHTSCCI